MKKIIILALLCSQAAFGAQKGEINAIKNATQITPEQLNATFTKCSRSELINKILRPGLALSGFASLAGGYSLSKTAVKATPGSQDDLLSLTALPLIGMGVYLAVRNVNTFFELVVPPLQMTDLITEIYNIQNSKGTKDTFAIDQFLDNLSYHRVYSKNILKLLITKTAENNICSYFDDIKNIPFESNNGVKKHSNKIKAEFSEALRKAQEKAAVDVQLEFAN